MQIGIWGYFSKQVNGLTRCSHELIRELLKMDRQNQYSTFGEMGFLGSHVNSIDMFKNTKGKTQLDFAAASYRLNLIHSYCYPFDVSRQFHCAKIFTVHDLVVLRFPQWHTGSSACAYFDGPMRNCASTADLVIADSESTKRDVMELFHIPEDKIRVVYFASFDKGSLTERPCAAVVQNVGRERYLLNVSGTMPNKNQKGLIQAFCEYKRKHKEDPIKLVLTGYAFRNAQLRQTLEKYRECADSIICTGFVSDEELIWLYRHAAAFAYVSFYEGFGLPILEALSENCPVICSNTSSMPEVGGDAAEYCNPWECDSIVSALENVLCNEKRREELIRLAPLQTAKFSYKKAARETLEIYNMFN